MPFKLLEKVLRRGSVLVQVKDGFTGEAALLPLKVRVKAAGTSGAARGEVDFITHRPGEYGFVELNSGDYELVVESPYFFKATVPFSYDASKGYQGVTAATLEPAPAYPFPPGTTLLRGIVVAANGKPAEGATIFIVERSEFAARTDGRGEFAIFFVGLQYSTAPSQSDFYKYGDGIYYLIPRGGSEADIELTVRATLGTASGEMKVRVSAEKVNTLGLDEEGKPKKIMLT